MNKLKLFENTYNKITADKAFIAFYLNEVSVKENKTVVEMASLLNCSVENYFKLALCKAPELNADFTARISKISEYANVDAIVLANIINYAGIQQKPKEISWFQKLENFITTPLWLSRSKAKIYQASVSICIIILLIIGYVPEKNETKNIQLFAKSYFRYTDSVKYTQVQDNTYVYKNNL